MSVLTSNANPILVAFRANTTEARNLIAEGVDLSMETLLAIWRVQLAAMESFGGYQAWNDPEHSQHFMVEATDAQVGHASKVIDRLYDLQVIAHV